MENIQSAQLTPEEFQAFLKEEANLDDATISKLLDAGFDDLESLSLIELETLKLIGLDDPKAVFKNLKGALNEEVMSGFGNRESRLMD